LFIPLFVVNMKRPAAAVPVTASLRSKTAKRFENVEVKVVSEALNTFDLPKSTLDMLQKMLPHAIEEPRHKFQLEVLDMLGTQFEEHALSLLGRVKDCEQRVANSEEQLRGAQVAAQTATDNLDKCDEELATASEKKSEALNRTKSAVDAVSKAESANDGVVNSVNIAGVKKIDLENAIEAKRVFLTSDVPHTELKSQSLAIRAAFDPLISDGNMLDAFQSMLSKPQENRGQFDGMVLKQFDEECNKVLSSLAESIANGDQQKALSQAEFAKACEAKEQAMHHQTAMVELHKDAALAKKNADASLKVARSQIKTFESAIRALTSELKHCNEELQKFQVGPKAALTTLVQPNEPAGAGEQDADARCADEADEMQPDAETAKSDQQETPETANSGQEVAFSEPVKAVVSTLGPAEALQA